MSDDELEENLRYLESHGYPLTAAERETIKWGNFVVRLSSRQGTIMPDFEALYRRKAKLDGKLRDPRR